MRYGESRDLIWGYENHTMLRQDPIWQVTPRSSSLKVRTSSRLIWRPISSEPREYLHKPYTARNYVPWATDTDTKTQTKRDERQSNYWLLMLNLNRGVDERFVKSNSLTTHVNIWLTQGHSTPAWLYMHTYHTCSHVIITDHTSQHLTDTRPQCTGTALHAYNKHITSKINKQIPSQ